MFDYVLTYDFMQEVGSALQQPRHTSLPSLRKAPEPAHTRKALE